MRWHAHPRHLRLVVYHWLDDIRLSAAGNGKSVTEFTINILESGTYSIYVKVHHAKGTVYIQRADGKKAQRSCLPDI